MAIASITAWLHSQDKSYSHGRALYEQYGDDQTVLAMIRSGSSPFHFKKLYAALEALNQKPDLTPKPIVIGEYIPEPAVRPGKAIIDFQSAPDQILQLRDQKNKRYAQARKLHESIRIMDSREHRLAAALELLDHMDAVNEIWSIIDEWKEKGHIREQVQKEQAKEVDAMSHVELLKEESLLGPNITKDRQRLAACTVDRKKLKIAERLQSRVLRMEAVRRRLSEFKS